MSMILRASMAQLADARALLQEYYEAVGVVVRDTPAQVGSLLTDPSCGLWIAYVEEVPTGCVALRPLAPSPHTEGPAAECKRLYVRPGFRGRGLADGLLDAMESHARSARVDWIYLDSKDDLLGARRIYKRRGYTECERYNDNPQATVFLRLRLEPGRSLAAAKS